MRKKLNDPTLISEQEFARRSGFSLQQIRSFRRSGQIEYYQFPTRNGLPYGMVRYDEEDLKKFMARYKFLGREPVNGNGKT